MLKFLPDYIMSALSNLDKEFLYEIRLRSNRPITVNFRGEYLFLTPFGIDKNKKLALTITYFDIEEIIQKATEYSIYSVTSQLNKGFITVEKGIRIGIAGEYVIENNKVLTIKNITSINIRLPHEIIGCSDFLYNRTQIDNISNLLILSPPGQGKTTILRDISRQISNNYNKNILIIDERNEIAAASENYTFDIGGTVDVIKYSDKLTAFDVAIRSMRPDLLITDELAGIEDVLAVQRAIYSGVKVIASCHLDSIDQTRTKSEFKKIYLENLFDYYAVLSGTRIGITQLLYDKNFNLIYGLS